MDIKIKENQTLNVPLAGKYSEEDLNIDVDVPTFDDSHATKEWVRAQNYLTAEDVVDKVNTTELENYYTKIEAENSFMNQQEVDDRINKIIAEASDTETINSLTSLVDYLDSHGIEAAAMMGAIETLKVQKADASVLNNYATLTEVEQKIANAESAYETKRLQKVYPIGAIYLSTVDTNPSTLFGFGTWEQIKDRFLLGASSTYNGGSTGGEASVKLTKANLPEETGSISFHGKFTGNMVAGASGVFSPDLVITDKYANGNTSQGANSVERIAYSNGGENKAHNNMPPYLAVYMWKRVS